MGVFFLTQVARTCGMPRRGCDIASHIGKSLLDAAQAWHCSALLLFFLIKQMPFTIWCVNWFSNTARTTTPLPLRRESSASQESSSRTACTSCVAPLPCGRHVCQSIYRRSSRSTTVLRGLFADTHRQPSRGRAPNQEYRLLTCFLSLLLPGPTMLFERTLLDLGSSTNCRGRDNVSSKHANILELTPLH